jgi:hypothetical protein
VGPAFAQAWTNVLFEALPILLGIKHANRVLLFPETKHEEIPIFLYLFGTLKPLNALMAEVVEEMPTTFLHKQSRPPIS